MIARPGFAPGSSGSEADVLLLDEQAQRRQELHPHLRGWSSNDCCCRTPLRLSLWDLHPDLSGNSGAMLLYTKADDAAESRTRASWLRTRQSSVDLRHQMAEVGFEPHDLWLMRPARTTGLLYPASDALDGIRTRVTFRSTGGCSTAELQGQMVAPRVALGHRVFQTHALLLRYATEGRRVFKAVPPWR